MKEFKNTIFGFAFSLVGVHVTVIIINILALINLVTVVDHPAWEWSITAMITFILYVLLWQIAASKGKTDIDIDGLNERRKEKNPNLVIPKQYVKYKGFLAGAIALIPAIVLMILNVLLKNAVFPDVMLRFMFSMHVKSIELWGTNTLAILIYIILFSSICGLAYLTGPTQKSKILTIIKRNREKSEIRTKQEIKDRTTHKPKLK